MTVITVIYADGYPLQFVSTGDTTKERVKGDQSLKGCGVMLSRALEWIVVFSKMGIYLGMVNVSKLSSLSSCTGKK